MSEGYVKIEPLDLSVYGQVQFSFSTPEASGLTYAEAAVAIAAKRALVVDEEVGPIQRGVREKIRKVEELGNALADVARIVAELAKIDLSDKSTKKSLTDAAYATLLRYEIKFPEDKPAQSLCHADALNLQQTVKLELDKENTRMQEGTNTLQGLIDKRSSAYGMIGKLQQKIDRTASTTIKSIGGN